MCMILLPVTRVGSNSAIYTQRVNVRFRFQAMILTQLRFIDNTLLLNRYLQFFIWNLISIQSFPLKTIKNSQSEVVLKWISVKYFFHIVKKYRRFNGFILQNDSAVAHKATYTMEYVGAQHITLRGYPVFPPYSHPWDFLQVNCVWSNCISNLKTFPVIHIYRCS